MYYAKGLQGPACDNWTKLLRRLSTSQLISGKRNWYSRWRIRSLTNDDDMIMICLFVSYLSIYFTKTL